MRGNRLFVSAAAIALVAGPGLAMAQSGSPSETPPVEAPPVETPPVEESSPVETPPFETPPVETPEAADEAEDLPETEEVEDVEVVEAEGEGHGETISALAECLPSGAELHGTGFNKGFIMRQAATEGEVMLGEGAETLPVASPHDAEALCAVVQDLADQAEAPETAKGRPDWAGPKDTDDSDDVAPAERRGPPTHANAGGKGPGGSSDDS